jgi:hypothetical protein
MVNASSTGRSLTGNRSLTINNIGNVYAVGQTLALRP